MSAAPSLSASSSVALTKFRVPRMRADTVVRAGLLHRLAGAVETTPLTLVCAPAGSGKTTLLTQLATTLRDQAGCTVLWIAIDADDNDANRLFAALVQAVAPLGLTWESDPRALAAGVNGAGHQSRVALAALVNALCTSPARRIVMVLDDLHRLDSDEAFLLLESLIERLPDHLALVLGSRVEPPLPLARWRVHGELAEFGPSELRFTEEEALQLAAQRTDEGDRQRIRDAWARSQGWAVGLTMLLQSKPQSDLPPSSFSANGGSDAAQRRLFEYLAEEILGSLPADLQAFVLRVSLLGEMQPALCDAVTGRSDSRQTLEALYRRNLFLTAVDESVPVLRFHDLFRDFLQAELARRHGTELRDLHERAARAETVPSRAIQHFLKAECWDDAVALIVRVGEALLMQGGIATIERWLAQIPESAHERNPKISYLRGACAWLRWDWTLARRELVPAFAGMTDPADLPQRIRAGFQLVDALNSSGEVDAAWRQLEELATLPLDELGQAELAVQRAWCLAPSGRLDEIEQHMIAFVRHTEHHPAAICPVIAGRIHCMLIGLPGVAGTFERFGQLADSVRTPVAAPWHLAAYAVAGWAALWRGDRTQALTALTRAQASFHQFGSIRLLGERIGQLKAVLCAVTGDFATAFRIGDEHIRGLQAPEVARHSAVWLRSYRHGVARMYWMAGNAEAHRALLPYLVAPRGPHEWPFTDTAADVARGQSLLLEGHWQTAIEPLTRAVHGYERHRMPAIFCDPRVSLAYAHLLGGERDEAWRVFAPVLREVIETRAFGVLLFDARRAVMALLDAVPSPDRETPAVLEVRRVLVDWTVVPATTAAKPATANGTAGAGTPLAGLSDRELEVLEKVAAGAGNKHIARDLDLSLHTVKRHVANILDKLDCASRGQAADLFRRLAPR